MRPNPACRIMETPPANADKSEGGKRMGMSDKQFESYKKLLLLNLETAFEAIKSSPPEEKEKLQKIIDILREELQRP